MEIKIDGRCITVEAAVSRTLPRSVLLGTDVQELSQLLAKDSGFTVLTRNQAQKTARGEA